MNDKKNEKTIELGKYEFMGPCESTDELRKEPGVYAVVSLYHGRKSVLSVGRARNIKTYLQKHAQLEEWKRLSSDMGGTIGYAVMYGEIVEKDDLLDVQEYIRAQFTVPESGEQLH